MSGFQGELSLSQAGQRESGYAWRQITFGLDKAPGESQGNEKTIDLDIYLGLRTTSAKRSRINLEINYLLFVAFSSIKAVGLAK